MKTHAVRTATVLLLALAMSSIAAAADRLTPAAPLDPAANVAPAAPPPTDCDQCGNCKTGCKSKTCCARLWDWLTYQPLCQPNKCCKTSPMPCCAPQLYWFFPCVDSYGPCPMGGYAQSCCCTH